MKWSEWAWTNVASVYERITAMPFIQELISGRLESEKFKQYIRQDALYLEHFGRTLALIAARAQEVPEVLQFTRFAEGAIVVEQALHASYFERFHIVGHTEISPACHHYIHFLKSTAALDQVEVGMAAVLPCFWIYKQVGDYIYGQERPKDNPYQAWIDTYAGEEFGLLTAKAIALCDAAAERCTPAQQAHMTRAFTKASLLEEMFWQSAWELEKWNS